MLVYLASPYSVVGRYPEWQKKKIKQERFEKVCWAACKVMEMGHEVFCPIAHSHPIEIYGKTPSDEAFWLKQDFAILNHCDEMWIVTILGWEQSSGIKKEMQRARWHGIPVKLFNIWTGETTDAPDTLSANDTQKPLCETERRGTSP